MKINPEIFRGYDIRGIWGKDLTPAIYEQIAKAYGTWLKQRRIVDAVVGCDSRLSHNEAKKAVIKGLTSTGINVYDIGMVLTQMVYFGQYHLKANGGIMITASHNPKEYNGMKMAAGYSNTLISSELQEIRKLAADGVFAKGEGEIQKVDIKHEYFDDLLKRVNITKKFKIALDTANGTPGLFAKDLFNQIGADVTDFNTKIDGSMPLGTPDPTEKEYLDRFSKETLDSKADIGIAFDTDGDRLGIVDEKGNPIWNDVIVALLARDILNNLPGAKIVYNALCSRIVDDVIRTAGGLPVMWLTGHSFIKQKVAQERAPFGGELSGHFFFADNHYGFDDGFFTVLRLLEYLSKQNKTVSSAISELPKYISSPEIKVTSPDAKKFEAVKELSKIIKSEFPKAKFTDIDGIRADFSESMLIIRASHNGPYITIKFEAKTERKYIILKKFIYKILSNNNYIDTSDGVNVDELK